MSVQGPIQSNTSGLVFHIDTSNPKSYVGEPTTNYAYAQNARIDSSYSLWNPGYGGTFAAKHPDAIRVYNDAGTEITNYVNTGVTDWTNTYHAIWTYDYILGRPVITMRDYDRQWKAQSFYMGLNFNTLGMTVGSKYTLSWMQWTDNLAKRANVGMYTRNSSSNYNFWDGLSSGSATSTNTKTYTWEKVYHTFTVTSNWNQADSYNSIYMYGMEFDTGVLKIVDVQFELKDHPTQFSKAQTRTATQGFIDLTGNRVLDMTYGGYNSSAIPTFTGASSNYWTLPSGFLSSYTAATISVWVYWTGTETWSRIFDFGTGTTYYMFLTPKSSAGTTRFAITTSGGAGEQLLSAPSVLTANAWNNVVITLNGSSGVMYLNGAAIATNNSMTLVPSSLGTTNLNYFGKSQYADPYFNGKIAQVLIYNRALTAAQVLRNYDAAKGRFGL